MHVQLWKCTHAKTVYVLFLNFVCVCVCVCEKLKGCLSSKRFQTPFEKLPKTSGKTCQEWLRSLGVLGPEQRS